MKGVIMAGGEGTRLRPLTSNIPKPMVPVMNKPVMEHIINLLRKHGIYDIAVTMCYLPNVITDYFDTGETLGVNLRYYIEEVPLGTGGSVLNTDDFLDEAFIVVSGDTFMDIDLQKVIAYHKEKGAKATLVLRRVSIPLEYGIVIIDEKGRILKFLEKPGWGEVFSDTINTGIYILEPEVFHSYMKGDNFDFSKDLFPKLLRDNIPMYGYVTEEYWNDIGDLNSYRQTHIDILDKKVKIDLNGNEILPGVFVEDDTILPKDIRINPPVYIGWGCKIKNGAFLDAYTVVGNQCVIGQNANLNRSIIWEKSRIGKSVACRGTILCKRVTTGNNVNFFEGSVVGSNCSIDSGATIKSNIKIWPNKSISENVIVNRNLVWGIRAARNIFGSRGIIGEINVDITPEFASLLGSAVASQFHKEKAVVVSGDDENASALIKECISAGLMAAGTKVISISHVITPISRFAVCFYQAYAGIHVSCNYLKENNVRIEIFNANGGNITRMLEKKIETLLIREDFERGTADTIGNMCRIENCTSFYLQRNISQLENLADIKQMNVKVAIITPSAEEASIAELYLKELGCSAECFHLTYKPNEIKSYVSYLSRVIKNSYFDMGIVLEGTGENIILIDKKGEPISQDKYILLAALVSLKSGICRNIIVPNTTTSKVEDMAKEHGAQVIRTKSSVSDIVNGLLNCALPDKEHMLQYQLHFDGIAAMGRIISFLVEHKTSLDSIIKDLPNFHMKKEEVICDFRERGRVIDELIRQNSDKEVELYEGIKIKMKNGWTLILPDDEKPVFSILAEGYTEEYADELSGIVTERVKEIIGTVRQE